MESVELAPLKQGSLLKEVTEVKSLFLSKTFLAICFTAIAALAPLIGSAVKEKKLTVDNAVQIVLILSGVGVTTVARGTANNSLVTTPDWLPGLNKDDILPLPVEEGKSVIGMVNEAGIASVEPIKSQPIETGIESFELIEGQPD